MEEVLVKQKGPIRWQLLELKKFLNVTFDYELPRNHMNET